MKNHAAVLPVSILVAVSILVLASLHGYWRKHSRRSLSTTAPHPLKQRRPTQTNASPFKPAFRCVLYDRPPRTGSTTISQTLDRCLQHKGYTSEPAGHARGRDWVVRGMLGRDGPRRASVLPHLVLTLADIDLIRRTCSQFLYISSAAPMADRLLSRIKYSMFDGHRNQTIAASAVVNRVSNFNDNRLAKLSEYETFLEAYPYGVNDSAVAGNESARFEPHYVISRESLDSDLKKLLKALQCGDVDLTSDNVHEVTEEREDEEEQDNDLTGFLRSRIEQLVRHADIRHKQLVELGRRRNQNALERAVRF